MTTAPAAAERPKLSFATILAYGFGAVANGVTARVVGGYALIFYNQVMGLPAAQVSLAIAIALIFDAFADPTVGQVSDNFRSRLGRRHPFMFASLLFYPIMFLMLWNPPAGLDHNMLFFWLLAFLIGVRVFDTFFELPSAALLPELITNYNERTWVLSMRWFLGVAATFGVQFMALLVFMREGPGGTGGIDERAGWQPFSFVCAGLIVASILIASLGTLKRIPYLRAPPTRKITLGGMAKEILSTLNNRNFVVATISGMFGAIAIGLYGGLNLYFSLYFWGLSQAQLAILLGPALLGTTLAIVVAPLVSRALGKRNGAITLFAIAIAVGNVPILLRLFTDLMPPNGSTLLVLIIAVEVAILSMCGTGTAIIQSAMVADIVEDSELKTGRRSEGLLLSADNLFKKVVSGAGVLASGAILTAVAFPANAGRVGVPADTLREMALLYLPSSLVLWTCAILTLCFFRINKGVHEENLRRLNAQGAAAE